MTADTPNTVQSLARPRFGWLRRVSAGAEVRLGTFWRRALCGLVALAVSLSVGWPEAAAQQRRSMLWLFEVAEDASVDRDVLAQLFSELLESATDAEHLVDIPGLAAYIERNGYPAPGCLYGLAPCADLLEAVAEELRLDVIATVRAYGTGQRMTLTVRGVPGESARTLEFTGDSLRQTAFLVVTDFVGASANLAVTSRPTGAEVLLDGESAGQTPYQATVPAGIYRVGLALPGYQAHEQVIELRPNQSRLIDVDLQREYAQLTVQCPTPGAVVFIDGEEAGPPTAAFQLDPGTHTIRVEAPDHTAEERRIEFEPGSDRSLPIELRESPEAVRRRRMGYIYQRPFFLRGSFRFGGTHNGLSDATGEIGGVGYTSRCPRSIDGTCSSSGIPLNWVGLDLALAYSFKHLEVSLLSFSYGAAQVGGSSGDGRTLTLIPDDIAAAGRDELAGRVTGVGRIDLRPLAVGVRFLFTDTWSAFAHGGFGWYRESFEAEDPQGGVGDFTRKGWDWMIDGGARYYLNDTLFLEAGLSLSGDLSHDDSDLITAFTVGVGITWPDILGINRLFGGDDEDAEPGSPPSSEEEGAPPTELDDTPEGS